MLYVETRKLCFLHYFLKSMFGNEFCIIISREAKMDGLLKSMISHEQTFHTETSHKKNRYPK
jgi:hypothetical protein